MKRENGRGSVYFEKSRNRWCVAVSLHDGTRKVRRFKTKPEAENYLEDLNSSMRNGAYIPQKDITIGQWLLTFVLTYKKDKIKNSTYSLYLSILKKLAPISTLSLQKESGINVQHFFNSLDCSIEYKKTIRMFLNMAVEKAVSLGMAPRNFMKTVELEHTQKKKVEVFSAEELKSLEIALKGSSIFPIFMIGKYTGMRPGEILALSWNDIDLLKNTISVNKNVYGGVIQATPKTSHSNRTISIGERLANYLGEYREKHYGEGLIFKNRKGKPYGMNSINKIWHRELAKAGIKYRTFYCLRHTHASLLLAHNVPITQVSARLGHANSSVTLSVYAHWIKDKNNDLGRKLDSFFA